MADVKPWEKYQTEDGPWSKYVDTPVDEPYKPDPTKLADRFGLMGAVPEIAVKGLWTGVKEIGAGLGGLGALILSGGDSEYAKTRVESWQNWANIDASSEDADYLMNQIAPTMSRADVAVDNFAESDGEGNPRDPLASAMIKAAIWTSVDIAGAAIPGARHVISDIKITKMRKQVIADAKKLGIDIHLDHFADDVASAAKMVGSESAGEAAMEYVTALRNAEYLARLKKNSLYAAGLDEKLFVSTSPVRRIGAELARDLDGPFDLDAPRMGAVRRTLDDMHSTRLGFGAGQNLAVHFSRFEMLRKRINSRIRDTTGVKEYGSANSALIQIRTRLDDFITTEFNKAALAKGGNMSNGTALSGDTQGLLTYLEARKANVQFAWFNENKVIADLIKKDTSVDQFAQWLVGASAVSKSGAAAVVNKMKVMLGPDHPAIAAVRADFIYRITDPLFETPPNLKQFVNNYNRVLRKNKPMVDALGLQESDVARLAEFAATAQYLPPGGEFYSLREIIQTVARLGVGHSVAKGAARVQFATKVMNAMGAVDKVTPAQILDGIVGARFDMPILPKGMPVTAAFTAGAALSDLSEEANK